MKEFVSILELHQRYPAKVVEMAVKQALTYGCGRHAELCVGMAAFQRGVFKVILQA